MKFIGNFQISIDAKGRIVIPSKFRSKLGNSVVVSFEFEDALVVRTIEDFESWASILNNKSTFSKDVRTLQRMILGRSEEISFDSKGRILLSSEFIKSVNLDSKIQIVGVGNKIEIYSTSKWEKLQTNSVEEAAETIEKLENN